MNIKKVIPLFYVGMIGFLIVTLVSLKPNGAPTHHSVLFGILFVVFFLAFGASIQIATHQNRQERKAEQVVQAEHYAKTCHEEPNLLALHDHVALDCHHCDFHEILGYTCTVPEVKAARERHDEREVFDDQDSATSAPGQ